MKQKIQSKIFKNFSFIENMFVSYNFIYEKSLSYLFLEKKIGFANLIKFLW